MNTTILKNFTIVVAISIFKDDSNQVISMSKESIGKLKLTNEINHKKNRKKNPEKHKKKLRKTEKDQLPEYDVIVSPAHSCHLGFPRCYSGFPKYDSPSWQHQHRRPCRLGLQAHAVHTFHEVAKSKAKTKL